MRLGRGLVLLMVLLSPVLVSAGCGETGQYTFAGPTPPSPESWEVCRRVCEKAACAGSDLDACMADCMAPRNEYLDCEYLWREYLKCKLTAPNLTCDKGHVYVSSCSKEGRLYQQCAIQG